MASITFEHGRELTDDEIISLGDAGYEWFRQICNAWKTRTGFNPVKVCREMKEADRVRIFWNRFSAAGFFLFFFAFMASGGWFASSVPATPEWYKFVAVIFSTLGLLAVFAFNFWYVPRRFRWGNQIYSLNAREIKADLGSFLHWAKNDARGYGDCSIDALRPDAKRILTALALKVVEHEHIPRESRNGNWGTNYDALKTQMHNAHIALKRLTLANETPTEYYREAERLYKEMHPEDVVA